MEIHDCFMMFLDMTLLKESMAMFVGGSFSTQALMSHGIIPTLVNDNSDVHDTVDGCEILHQLIDGLSQYLYGFNHPFGGLSDFATIHSMEGLNEDTRF